MNTKWTRTVEMAARAKIANPDRDITLAAPNVESTEKFVADVKVRIRMILETHTANMRDIEADRKYFEAGPPKEEK